MRVSWSYMQCGSIAPAKHVSTRHAGDQHMASRLIEAMKLGRPEIPGKNAYRQNAH